MKHQHLLSDNRSITRWAIATLWLALVMLSGNSVLAQNPAYQFALGLGSSGVDAASEIATDANGNLYVTGKFSGVVDFDASAATLNLTAAGSTDAFVAKFDSGGNTLWAFNIGGTGGDAGTSLAIDGGGNIVVRGEFANTVDFDPGAGTANLTAVGTSNMFLAKYTAAGNWVWSFGLPVGQSYGKGLAIDGSSNIVVCGNFRGAVDMNPGAGTAILQAAQSASNNPDLFVARYSATGGYLSAFRVGGADFETANAVAIDNAGNIFVAGYFGSTGGSAVNFNPFTGPKANLTSKGGPDMFLAKYSTTKCLWAFNVGGSGADQILRITTDGSNVVVCGMFNGTADFNPGSGTNNLVAQSSQDAFVARYTSSGAYSWAVGIGPPCGQCQGAWSTDVAIDGNGDIHLIGNFTGTADFDGSTSTAALTSEPANATNAFVARYSSAGTYISAFALPGTTSSNGGALALGSSGEIYISGQFQGTVDLDPSAATASLTSAGITDGYIAKYREVVQPKRVVSGSVSNEMRITPNPFTGEFTLSYNGLSAPSRIRIIDMMGEVVERREMTDATEEIVLGAELPAGAYLIEIVQGEERRTMPVRKVR
jgi:hypothetical protein